MQAGVLDQRITLYHRSSSRDAQGQSIETFAEYATVWAEKTDLKGREFSIASQVNAELTSQFVIRWRSDVLNTDRLSVDGNDYNIRQILEIPRHKGLQLMATAIVK